MAIPVGFVSATKTFDSLKEALVRFFEAENEMLKQCLSCDDSYRFPLLDLLITFCFECQIAYLKQWLQRVMRG